ncbi:FGGY family carbohydrate kinase [Fontivita pretiosa]|uniref:FGGY family carbohydrate kinase n=1 Tax=Fontivita pretiosa TaxID=2989684 RepID=UPI003D1844C1
MSTILAIDQSTSATKALLYDTDGNLLEKVSIEHRQIYPEPGLVEHDAEQIWQNTLAAMRGLLQQVASRAGEIAGLSITNQRETFVVFDRATGQPLHNAIVWQCRRGDPICAELKQAGHEPLVARKTGLKIDTYFSASKLAWLIRHRPQIGTRLASGEALFGTIDTYLIYRLTNGQVFATDHTNASRTLLFDIGRLAWDEELCSLFGVPMRALPQVRDSTARFGTTDLHGLLDRQIPICGVMGDSQASLFAHRCFSPGMAKVTLGSGSSLLLNVGSEVRSGGDAAVTTVAWTHAGRPTYSFEGIINYSAATIEWLKNQLGLIRDAAESEAAARSVPDNGGVYLVPAFAGLSAPYWSAGARAAIVGMTAHTNRNHIIRAALESIAYQIRDVLDAMKHSAGIQLRAINADGGATRNRLLMQFIADMTGLQVNAARIAECSPLGAAMAGMLGLGVHRSLDELAKLPREVQTYQPAMPQAQVERLHAGWKRAVRQVLAGAEP